MAYGLEYRSEWKMMNDTDIVRVSIFDTDTITDDPPTIVNMVPSGNPLTISIIDNDRDKYKAIKSRQAKIEVLTSNEVGFETFADAHENKYRVEIRLNPDGANTAIFFGFLSLADNQEDFLPDPNVLVLTATDHLGMIKDIPMTMPSGANPSGKSKMIDYLSWCLRKTGLDLEIYAVNNLRHGSGNLGNSTTFSASGNYFVTAGLLTDYFYPGQIITISGTASNNGTFTVESVDNSGLVSQVTLTTAITTGEVAPGAEFVDETSTEYFYDHYLDAKTFEDEIGTCEDCYSVIEKILGYDCFVTQYAGRWWIFRIDEWDLNDIYVLRYSYDGVVNSFEAGTTYNKTVGRGEVLSPVTADWLVTADRPHLFTKLTYNYNIPLETPCNIVLDSKNYIADLSDVTIDNIAYTAKSYQVDCWNYGKGFPMGGTSGTQGYIRKLFDKEFGYEKARALIIPTESVGLGTQKYYFSDQIPVSVGDKITISFDWSYSGDSGSSSEKEDFFAAIRLISDDGITYYGLLNDGRWTTTAADSLAGILVRYTPADIDMREWQSASYTSDRLPTSGMMEIYMVQGTEYGGSYDTRFSNIRFEYASYIAGSFNAYTGQHQKVTSDESRNIAKLDDEVFISDSPKPIYKGSMFRQISTYVFTMCKKWFPYNVFQLTLPQDGNVYSHPYGEVQIRSVFNQYRNANRVFTGSIKGLSEDWPDLIHKYTLTDTNPNTNDRFFMIASFEQNWKSGYMSGTWIEVYKEPGKGYSEDREFKYISQ